MIQDIPAKESANWTAWAAAFGGGLRKTLLAYRHGARMVAGSRLTNTEYMKTEERVEGKLIGEGFTVRQAVVLLNTELHPEFCHGGAVCLSAPERAFAAIRYCGQEREA